MLRTLLLNPPNELDQLDDWRDRNWLWHFRSGEFAYRPRRGRRRKARRHERS